LFRPRIIFNGKAYRVANISQLNRHGPRKKITDLSAHSIVPLTNKGKKESFLLGQELDKGFTLKTYFSPLKRARQTAHQIYKGHKSSGGTVAKYSRHKRIGVRQELTHDILKDPAFLEKEQARFGGDNNPVLNKWLDGKYSKNKFIPSRDIAKRIISKRLALGQRAARKGAKGWLILNVTHDWHVMAVLNELLGKNPFALKLTTPKPNKGLKIYHTKEGLDILEYQGKRFDVTEKLKAFQKK